METENDVLAYKVKTTSFEGPFHLLLSLIEERKLFINEISLATVTEDYIRHVNSLPNILPHEIASFVSVAGTLILIKSKSLLPELDLTDEEQTDIKNLETRLRLYELFTNLSLDLKKKFGKELIFTAEERKNFEVVFLPDEQITTSNLMQIVGDIFARYPQKTILPEVEVKKVISIEEMIGRLTDRIETALRMNFKDFAGRASTKEEKVLVIVGFLAMLELTRQGILNTIQENNFDDIIIEKMN